MGHYINMAALAFISLSLIGLTLFYCSYNWCPMFALLWMTLTWLPLFWNTLPCMPLPWLSLPFMSLTWQPWFGAIDLAVIALYVIDLAAMICCHCFGYHCFGYHCFPHHHYWLAVTLHTSPCLSMSPVSFGLLSRRPALTYPGDISIRSTPRGAVLSSASSGQHHTQPSEQTTNREETWNLRFSGALFSMCIYRWLVSAWEDSQPYLFTHILLLIHYNYKLIIWPWSMLGL